MQAKRIISALLTSLLVLTIGPALVLSQAPANLEPYSNPFPAVNSLPVVPQNWNSSNSAMSTSAEQTSVETEEVEKIVQRYLAEREAQHAGAPPTNAPKQPAMSAKWNHGLEFSSPDEDFRFHVGGRYQFDTSFFGADQAVQDNINVPYGDGVDFRRARFRMDGTVYNVIDFATEIDFANSFRAANQPVSITNPGFVEATTVALTDFWWQVRDVPLLGSVRIGQHKEGIGFEHLVSSRWLPFMERSFNQDTFYGGVFNGFTPGISALRNYGENDMGLIHYGLFKPTNNVFGISTGDGDYSLVGRVTRLLWYDDQGRSLMHIGVSGKQASAVRQASSSERVQTYRTRDAIRSGLSQDWPVPAGISVFGDDYQQVNLELAGVNGPWTMQGEYLVSGQQDARVNLNAPSPGTAVYHGGYIQLLYLLTGESDQYNKRTGVFERVIPNRNFSGKDICGNPIWGGGAWQLGARYNYLDLNDIGLNGGVLHNQTYGLNWFLNPNVKAQLNYSATYRDVSQTVAFAAGSGWIHGYGLRLAMDF